MRRRPPAGPRRARIAWAVSLLALPACHGSGGDIAAISYVCETSPAVSPSPGDGTSCGAGDPSLPPEPTLPGPQSDVCTLKALQATTDTHWLPDETSLDTDRISAALVNPACKGPGKAVRLVTDGANNAFVAATLRVAGVTMWVDAGVTLYASRNPALYQKTGSCGVLGINDSGACTDFITMSGASPAIVGDGVIDGQGGEPLIGHDYSWWQMSYALRAIDGSIGNPTLVNTATGTTGLLLYRITLHNSPKFHVKLTSAPAAGVTSCDSKPYGAGFIVWGVTVLTPSRWLNSQGFALSPSLARNTDGIDPGENNIAFCGIVACSTVSTGDDNIALKGGHWVSNVTIAHNHFGTGHGMSIGSETYGSYPSPQGTVGVANIDIHDLTIDADSRPVGGDANPGDFNGIRVKSDESRGGIVNNVTYRDVCMRDMTNAILMSTAYNPLFAGNYYPQFSQLTFENVRHVSCLSKTQPVITLNGFSAELPARRVTLDNVIIDNIGQQDVEAQFAEITLGPGDVNFTPTGMGVQLTPSIVAGSSAPKTCVFPTLPTPTKPPGWLN